MEASIIKRGGTEEFIVYVHAYNSWYIVEDRNRATIFNLRYKAELALDRINKTIPKYQNSFELASI